MRIDGKGLIDRTAPLNFRFDGWPGLIKPDEKQSHDVILHEPGRTPGNGDQAGYCDFRIRSFQHQSGCESTAVHHNFRVFVLKQISQSQPILLTNAYRL